MTARRRRPLAVLVLGSASKPAVRALARRLVPWLQERTRVVAVDLHRRLSLAAIRADMAIVLGGDGAILRAARQMGHNQIPVLGVNLGKLGFLAELSADQFQDQFASILRGQYNVTQHMVLQCRLQTGQEHLVFNDVVISAGPPFQIIDIDLAIDGERVTTYSGDGLILSTPVGSTAHSLSAGGPILRQEIDAVVVTPICPHTLANRPLVDRADKCFDLTVTRASRGTTLILDGQVQRVVRPGETIRVSKAPVRLRLVRTLGYSYYRTLGDKLRWGGQPNYAGRPNR